ncbi:hypothetical protein B0H14DRAFT_3448999 [Mycena olivaceomarginata]|nr:hypothetical protein B0H14DRAFT_3448999 [Mycena olivaceomarginata]
MSAALAYMLQLRLLFAVLVKTWSSYLTLPGAAAGGKGLTEWWLRVGVSIFVVIIEQARFDGKRLGNILSAERTSPS